MKLRDHYDWMVLGHHPGALLSAGLAARLGLSVLILPIYPGKGVVISRTGQVMDPESNFLAGLGKMPRFNGLLAECLSRLGILPAELEQVQGTRPLPQVLTPEFRLDFGGDDASLAGELARELGGDRSRGLGMLQALARSESEFLSHWLQLPERLTLVPGKKRPSSPGLRLSDARKRVSRSPRVPMDDPAHGRWLAAGNRASGVAAHLRAPELQSAMAGLWSGIATNRWEDPSLDALLHMFALGRTGASFRGGMSAYRELLLRLARRLGAHVPPQAECKRVFVERGRFAGAQLASRGTVITSGGAILGCALDEFKSLVTEGGRSWFRKLKASPRPEGWFFTLAFTTPAGAVPPGASPRMIWKEPGAPVLELELASPEDYAQRETGSRLIMARAMLPFTQESLTLEYQRSVAARIFRQVTEVFPFIESQVTDIFPEFRGGSLGGVDRAGELEGIYGFSSLSQIPENLRCLSPEGEPGVGSHSGVEGLFVATGESFPELGSFGSTVAALESVSWLAHRGGLAGPFA